jgi:uncharacterized protein with PQ loop repeat
MATQLIGWAAAAILLATLGRQVYSQWRDRTSEGVSKWLFVGQVSASVGFIVYSWLLAELGVRRNKRSDSRHSPAWSVGLPSQ